MQSRKKLYKISILFLSFFITFSINTFNLVEANAQAKLTSLTFYQNGDSIHEGQAPTVAITESNQVIVLSQENNQIYYAFGVIDESRNSISWKSKHARLGEGENPSITLTNDGYVVATYSKSGELYARTASIHATYLNWSRSERNYGSGENPSVAFTGANNYELMFLYEKDNGYLGQAFAQYRGNGSIYYVSNPIWPQLKGSSPDLTMTSDGLALFSGSRNFRGPTRQYAFGQVDGDSISVTQISDEDSHFFKPQSSIVIKDNGLFIEFFQNRNNMDYLEYKIGQLSGSSIQWLNTGGNNLMKKGVQPDVAINNQYVIQVHKYFSSDNIRYNLYQLNQ
ncbi:hypothetical protein IC620_03625 [Hazenella sp. IB182357]|uniref:Uncharacterized protein n=1 Tax=Polycladospora coralii TaxID=2771432 RepID=A0A926RTA5_9BACL|nr:hypothetical protein [Polycladospora coralii]MBD1371443.1 hypothetical protein [Polycladospora coralii]